MEPVEIDFVIGGNIDSEGGKVVRSLDDITQAGKRSIAEAKKAVSEQKAVVKQIERDIRDIEKTLRRATPGKEKFAAEAELRAAKKVLEEEKGALAEYEKKVDDVTNSHKQLRTQIMEAKDALAKLEMQGKRDSAEWNAVAERLGVLNDQMGDTTRQAKILADDQKGFRAVASAASGMAGAMSAAVGVASLLGTENENLVKIQTRLQSVMAITIGLQQVSETLNKDSYYSIVLLSAVKKKWAAAQSALNTQLGIGVKTSKMLMYGGVGVLIGGIALLVSAYNKWKTKQEEINSLRNDFKKIETETRKTIQEEITSVKNLERVLENSNNSYKVRKDALDKLKELMPGYNAQLTKEGTLIRDNTGALVNYVEQLKYAALAKSAMSRVVDAENELTDFYDGLGKVQQATLLLGRQQGGSIEDPVHQKMYNYLEGEVSRIEAKRDAAQKLLEEYTAKSMQAGGSGKGTGKEIKVKTEKEAYDAQKAISEKLLDLRQQTARLEIEQMEDGLQKRLAQIDHEGAAEVAKVAETQQKIVEEYNKSNKDKKGFVPAKSITDIDPKAAAEFEAETLKIKTNTDKLREKAAEEHQKNIFAIARKYADERVQIEFDYNEDIKRLEAEGQTEAANAARAKRDKAVSDATAEMIRETEIYRLAMDSRLNVSAEVTEKLIADIRRRVEVEMAAGKLTAEQGKKILDEITKAGISREFGKNPFKDLLRGLKQYKRVKEELDKKRGNTTTQELAELEDAANKTLEATAAAAAAALTGIADILGTAVSAMDELGLLSEQQKKDAEDIIGMVGGAADIASGIATGNPVQIIQGAVSFIAKAASFFDFKSKRIKKQQEKIIEQVNELGRAYNRLQHEVERALGTDVFAKQRAQIENLKKQILEYQKLIELENKKRKKKRNQQAIDEWKQAIEDAQAQMETIMDSIREQLTGTNTKSMAGDLANALVSAFQEGGNAAEAFGQVFDDVIRNAVLNAFKLKYLEKPIDEWLNMLGDYMDDGELQSWEKKALEGRRDAIFQSSKAGFDAISELFKTNAPGTQAQGIKGDVRNMSEDTGTALVGAINGMRINVDAMLKRMQTFGELMDGFSRHLEKIQENTSFCKKLKDIDETLTDLKNNGIRIR